jgi:hypothetical protein
MNDLKVLRWTGAFGVASIALILVAQPLWFIGGTVPRLEDTVKFSEYVTRNNAIILTLSLADTLINEKMKDRRLTKYHTSLTYTLFKSTILLDRC